MMADPCRLLKTHARPAAALIGLMVAACTPQYQPAQQVQASNPTVTYQYYTDGELLQVNQTAAGFCNQYQALPRAASFTVNPDNSKQVVFECVPPTATMAAMAPAPYGRDLTYNFQSDQELLTASMSARAYCRNLGSQQVTSSIVPNLNGTNTVTFQCGPT
jgi:hypothetical protein